MGKREGQGSEYNNNDNKQKCESRTGYSCSAASTAAIEGYRHIGKSNDRTADKYRADNFGKPNFGYNKNLGKQLVKRGWWSR
jgi:hypothetical protein